MGRSSLTDNPQSRATAAASGWLKSNPRFVKPNLTANIEASKRFQALATKMGISAAGPAIAWLLHKAPHILLITGTRSVDHLREHCDGVEKILSSDGLGRIEATLPIGWAHGDRLMQMRNELAPSVTARLR